MRTWVAPTRLLWRLSFLWTRLRLGLRLILALLFFFLLQLCLQLVAVFDLVYLDREVFKLFPFLVVDGQRNMHPSVIERFLVKLVLASGRLVGPSGLRLTLFAILVSVMDRVTWRLLKRMTALLPDLGIQWDTC